MYTESTAGRNSAKLAKIRTSLTLQLKEIASSRESQGLPVYDFGLGETKGDLAEHLRAAGEDAFRNQDTMYADPAGLPELRDAVLNWLGQAGSYRRENVIITAGAKPSIFNVFLAVCNPGDVMLMEGAPWVSYAPLAYCTYTTPIMVLPLEKKEKNFLKVTPEDLLRNIKLRPHARLFLLNSPCNPTGQLYSAQEIDTLLNICVEHEMYFVIDRLYWRIVFDGESYPEPRIDDKTKDWLVQIDGLSKNFRRTGGLRMGWTVGPADLIKQCISLQSHYTSGPAVPMQRVAQAAITADYDDEMVRDLEQKRNLLQEGARDIPHVNIFPTPAAFYSFWDVRDAIGMKTPQGELLASSDDVASYLMNSEGVITASGTGFFQDGYLRLSFHNSEEVITQGMAAARRAFEALS